MRLLVNAVALWCAARFVVSVVSMVLGAFLSGEKDKRTDAPRDATPMIAVGTAEGQTSGHSGPNPADLVLRRRYPCPQHGVVCSSCRGPAKTSCIVNI